MTSWEVVEHPDGVFWIVEIGRRLVVFGTGPRPTDWSFWSEHTSEAEARSECARLTSERDHSRGERAQWGVRRQEYVRGRRWPPLVARY